MELYIIFLALLFIIPIYLQIVVALWLQTFGWFGLVFVAILALPIEMPIVFYLILCAFANLSGWRLWLQPKNKYPIMQKEDYIEAILDTNMFEQPVLKGKLWVRNLSFAEWLVGVILLLLSYYAAGMSSLVDIISSRSLGYYLIIPALSLYPLGLFLIARLHYAGFWMKAIVQFLILCLCFAEMRLVGDWATTFTFSGLLFLTVLNAYFGVLWLKARQNPHPNTLV
jgi:hypothetical protein